MCTRSWTCKSDIELKNLWQELHSYLLIFGGLIGLLGENPAPLLKDFKKLE